MNNDDLAEIPKDSSATRPTKRQRELLEFIREFIETHGYGPSYREVMRGLNYKSVSTVATHINSLISRGHLTKRNNSARSLEIVDDPNIDADFEPSKVKASQEKWLMDEINTRFKEVEKTGKPTQREIDELYVLVGALKILGFEEAARMFVGKLTSYQ